MTMGPVRVPKTGPEPAPGATAVRCVQRGFEYRSPADRCALPAHPEALAHRGPAGRRQSSANTLGPVPVVGPRWGYRGLPEHIQGPDRLGHRLRERLVRPALARRIG